MRALLSLLALPLVLIAMLVAPLFGIHFCPEEALPVAVGIGALPFIGPTIKRKLLKRSEPHCCVDHDHTPVKG